jgi:hypothetical protein
MSEALKIRAQTTVERIDMLQRQHEGLLAERGDGELSDTDKKQITMWREEREAKSAELDDTLKDIESYEAAMERSKALKRAQFGSAGIEEGGPVYDTMAAYARDVMLTRESRVCSQIAAQFGDKSSIEAARARQELLMRTPANTLSSNVTGLQPEQHIAQIFQVIETRRPLVASAFRTTLERGSFTFPKITQRPVVAVQATEKTEAGNTGMIVTMETATASTYLGGGDLSWQAINWSTPDALDLWFRLAASDYALKTEQDAGEVVQTAAFLNDISTLFGATGTYAEFLTAVAAGMAAVYANSGEIADTLYLAPDRAFYLLGLTSEAQAIFANGTLNASTGNGNIASLNIVVSRGLDSGVVAVGVADHLIVAETAGAPVELRVVEPAIGGVEVGIIGAFEAVVAQDESFALLTAAS